jgi:hypothetical protein
MHRTLPAVLLAVYLLGFSVRAEDWTTTDGKTYPNVKVLKVEPDVVTILYRDGGAALPLASLAPDLQRRFSYNPVKASAAAAVRAQADADNIKALQAEKDKIDAKNLASAQAIANEEARAQTNAANNAQKPSPAQNDALQSQGGKKDGPRDIEHSDPRTHYMGM